jgi:hypothetical protein
MAFGKADIGLIKATAGAEKAQFIDDDLMMGAAIGTFLNGLNEQTKLQNSISAGLEKEVNEKINVVTGNPSKQLMENLNKNIPIYKTQYVSNKGKDYQSQSNRQGSLDNANGIVQQTEDITGALELNSAAASFGPGASSEHKYYVNMLNNGDYQVETRKGGLATGYDAVNVAIAKKMKPIAGNFIDETTGISAQSLFDKKEDDPSYAFNEEEQAIINRFNKATESFNTWNSLPDKVDGYFNPEKYKIFNHKNFPVKGENLEHKTAQLDFYNQNISLKKTDTDLLNPQSAKSYADGWEQITRTNKISGVDLQNTIFGDMSDDGIDNSFASIFIDGANEDKHPDIYKDLNGNPLKFNSDDKGGFIEWGSTEWKALDEDKQRALKENFLRGRDTDGGTNLDANKEWIIKKHSAFMGQVTKDAFDAKRRLHFEQKGRFFNDGITDQNVFTSKEVALNRKKAAYNNALVDVAFPAALLTENLEESLDEGGTIAKALEDVFKDYDVSFDFDDGVVTFGGEEYDFTGDNKASELARMKRDLSKPKYSPDEFIIDGLSNSLDGKDWQDIRDRKYDYHTATRVGTAIESEDYSPFESSTGNLVTGKLEIVGVSEDNEVYQVRDSNGITHSVPKATLYPNQ